jgi:hypothetical protein
MSSLPPFAFFCAAATLDEEASAVGRVLAAGGGALLTRAAGVVLLLGSGGGCDGVELRFGNDPLPGGGGGFDGAGCDAEAARIEPDGGGADGAGPDAGIDGTDGAWLGGWAGPGIPINVFFMSGPLGRAATCAPEPGGGGGVADVRAWLFFPRPSKISRSEPPLLSSDIRVS